MKMERWGTAEVVSCMYLYNLLIVIMKYIKIPQTEGPAHASVSSSIKTVHFGGVLLRPKMLKGRLEKLGCF